MDTLGIVFLKDRNMNAMILLYLIGIIFGIGFIIWMKTPKGKKWLANL